MFEVTFNPVQDPMLREALTRCSSATYVNPKRYPNGQSGRSVKVVMAQYEDYVAAARVQEEIERATQTLIEGVMALRREFGAAYRPQLLLALEGDDLEGWELQCVTIFNGNPMSKSLSKVRDKLMERIDQHLEPIQKRAPMLICGQDVRRATSPLCRAHGNSGLNLVGMTISAALGKMLDTLSTIADIAIEAWVTHEGDGVLAWDTLYSRVQDYLTGQARASSVSC